MSVAALAPEKPENRASSDVDNDCRSICNRGMSRTAGNCSQS